MILMVNSLKFHEAPYWLTALEFDSFQLCYFLTEKFCSCSNSVTFGGKVQDSKAICVKIVIVLETSKNFYPIYIETSILTHKPDYFDSKIIPLWFKLIPAFWMTGNFSVITLHWHNSKCSVEKMLINLFRCLDFT